MNIMVQMQSKSWIYVISMDPDTLKIKCKEFLQKLEITKTEILNIERKIQGQHDNPFWMEMRRQRLTASNFGKVCKLRETTLAANTVKNILYGSDLNDNPNIIYGRVHEAVAIKKYENLENVTVKKCGLFIDEQHPYLAASPDGFIEEKNALVEVKCMPSVKTKFCEVRNRTNLCYNITNGNIRLKPEHTFLYQMQGQLNITKTDYCDLILYCDNDFYVERIWRDEAMWEQRMIPLLKRFYEDSLLPELVDPRGKKRIREPTYRIEQNKKLMEKREMKLK